MKMPEFARIMLAELSGMLATFWISVALWHFFEPAKDAWYSSAWGATCAFVGLIVGVGVGCTIWYSTRNPEGGK